LSKPKTITVLGSTGSVGTSTLDLAARAVAHGSAEVQVIALTAGANVALLAEQALEWRPKIAVIADERLLGELRQRLKGSGVACAAGEAAVIEAAGLGCDWVMSAIMGSAGLAPTLAAVKTGAVIGLANKESLVCAGPALLEAAKAAYFGARDSQPTIPQPAAPKFSMPQPPAPVKAPSTNTLLMAILGLLMFLVGGFIVFLLMRR